MKIRVDHDDDCPECGGEGAVLECSGCRAPESICECEWHHPGPQRTTCPTCDGWGVVEED